MGERAEAGPAVVALDLAPAHNSSGRKRRASEEDGAAVDTGGAGGAAQKQQQQWRQAGGLMELVASQLLSDPLQGATASRGGVSSSTGDNSSSSGPLPLQDAGFAADWAAAGGGPCVATLRRALAALSARDAAALALPAQALQDVCWEQLHSGHWSQVDISWRDAYSVATLLVAAAAVDGCSTAAAAPPAAASAEAACGGNAVAVSKGGGGGGEGVDVNVQLAWALRQLDLAAMMGGPRFRAAVDAAAAAVETAMAAAPDSTTGSTPRTQPQTAPAVAGNSGSLEAGKDSGEEDGPPLLLSDLPSPPVRLPPGALSDASRRVPVIDPPSLEAFLLEYMLAPDGGRPVVIRGAMTAWPALSRWPDPRYLISAAGRRTVPVELGSHYLAEGWGTQLMTLGDFMRDHVLAPAAGAGYASTTAAAAVPSEAALPATVEEGASPTAAAPPPAPPAAPAAAGGEGDSPATAASGRPRGYLAQHELFSQIPVLAADVITPDYCSLGEDGAVRSVNAWLGPAGTVTPFHQDPYHNFLAQVVGRKYVRLISPTHTAALYPHESGMHTNTSRVDADSPDTNAFPDYPAAPFLECVLGPGEMLYLPPRWWHYVKALSASFSCSFWWS